MNSRKNIVLLLLTIGLLSCNEKVKTEINVKNDTLVTKVLNINEKEDLEKNGFYAEENFVIANQTFLRDKPSKKNANIVDTLQFGDKIFIKSVYYPEEGESTDAMGNETALANEKKDGFVAVYLKKPTNINDKPNGYLPEKVLTQEYEFKNYKKYFSLKEFKKLDSGIKKLIVENSYLDGSNYYLTESAQKAPNAICSADFDGDGLKDYAVVLDNVEKQHSMVMVFLMNTETKDPYVAYRIEYTEYLKLKIIPKNTEVLLYDETNVEGNPFISSLPIIEFFGKENASYLAYDEAINKMVQK